MVGFPTDQPGKLIDNFKSASSTEGALNYINILKKPLIYSTLPLILINGFVVYGSFAYLGSHLKEVGDLSYLGIGAILSSWVRNRVGLENCYPPVTLSYSG